VSLKPGEQNGNSCVFECNYVPKHTGRLGYGLRITPNHFIDPITRPCGALIRWA